MRKILLGATVLVAAGGAFGVTSAAQAAYTGGSCSYTTTGGATVGNPTVDPVLTSVGTTVGVQAGPGGLSGAATAEVGACVNIPGGVAGFFGGAAGVGVQAAPQSNRLCVPATVDGLDGSPGDSALNYTAPVGVYGVADGNNANTLVPQTGGYAGVSNLETGGNEGCPPEPNNGGGTNSGGSVGISAVGVYAPVPFVVCGNDSGGNYAATGRDGCYIDTT